MDNHSHANRVACRPREQRTHKTRIVATAAAVLLDYSLSGGWFIIQVVLDTAHMSCTRYQARILFVYIVFASCKKFTPSCRKQIKIFGTKMILSYNHARQEESRGIAQTMESCVRYGTH